MIYLPQALAHVQAPKILTAAQIATRLDGVPCFLIVNAQGQPLTATQNATVPEGAAKPKPAIGVFLRQKPAAAFLEALQKRDPAAAALKLKVVSLGEVYRNAQKPEANISLAFIPDPEQVELAKKLIAQQAKPGVAFTAGVPLFIAELTGKGLLNVSQNGKTTVPVFFSLADLTPVVERYNKQKPEGTPEAKIVVTTLEFLLQNWGVKPDPALAQMQLLINKAVVDEAKTLTGGS